MIVVPSLAWKLALALALGVAIVFSVSARAPRQSLPPAELRRLLAAALGLYAVGAAAWLTHHLAMAALVYVAGIAVAAIGAWLSRGADSDDPPSGGPGPADEEPPPDPDGLPRLDWDAFERAFRGYVSERERTPAGRG